MIYAEHGKEQECFITFIEQTLAVLSCEDYTAFLALFDDRRFSEQDLILALRYLDETCPITKIDNPLNVKCENRLVRIIPHKDGTGYSVNYDLSTNGEINDLTIHIEFLANGDGYQVVLDDLHTM